MNGPSKQEQERFRAESDLRTLVEASRIRSDKARSDAASKLADEQATELKKIRKGTNGG